MDPNLEKIRDANLEDIRQGKFNTAIKHADNYLFYMTNGDQYVISHELGQFIKNIKSVHKSLTSNT